MSYPLTFTILYPSLYPFWSCQFTLIPQSPRLEQNSACFLAHPPTRHSQFSTHSSPPNNPFSNLTLHLIFACEHISFACSPFQNCNPGVTLGTQTPLSPEILEYLTTNNDSSVFHTQSLLSVFSQSAFS